MECIICMLLYSVVSAVFDHIVMMTHCLAKIGQVVRLRPWMFLQVPADHYQVTW